MPQRYDSAGLGKRIADALREVYASVWLFQGFEERTYYRINHALVAMGVLIQESIDDDTVNGVAITANPFNEGRPGHFINVQVAAREGSSVTSARAFFLASSWPNIRWTWRSG